MATVAVNGTLTTPPTGSSTSTITGNAHQDCNSSAAHKYRGAVVEDLQLPPAFTLPESECIGRAIEQAYDRDFSHVPILSKERKPIGYLDVPALKTAWEAGKVDLTDNVLKRMSPYERIPSRPYVLITPDTPLDELEDFLKKNKFVIVTDYDRKFVLAVATLQDLERGDAIWMTSAFFAFGDG